MTIFSFVYFIQGGYPARLKNVFIISPPFWFKAFLTLLTSFLQQKLRDRIEIVPRESLVQRLPHASVPESLGGMLKVDHFAWLNTCLMSFSESMKENGVVNARQGNRDLIYTESSITGVDAGVTDEGALSVMEFMEHLMKLTPKGIKNEFVDLKRRSGNGNFYSAK